MRIDLYQDGIGYVEDFDFSRANMTEKSRIDYVQQVASICYNSPAKVFDEDTGKGKVLYDKLLRESLGLPSSSFEFVPVLLHISNEDDVYKHSVSRLLNLVGADSGVGLNIFKYGEIVEDGKVLITNLRALIADVGYSADHFYNTDEGDIALIKKHFKVFKSKIPLFTARQFMRHRCSWQELSRRYVSNKKQEFEFYISPKLDSDAIEFHCKFCVQQYNRAIEQEVLPQDARQILPQSMYTEMWSAWYPSQLQSMIDLRTAKSTQTEFRALARGIKTLVN